MTDQHGAELWPCPRCQARIPSTSTVCPNCGLQLRETAPAGAPGSTVLTTTGKSGWRSWSTRKKIAVAAIAVIAILLLLSALGRRPGTTPGTGTAPDAPASRCQAASAGLVASIEEGLNVAGGGSLRNAQIVKSNDFENAYFVSADIEGEGMDGDNIGTWVTNAPQGGSGLLYSVNALAEGFSDWGPGGQTDAQFSMSDDGAEESARCAAGG